MVGGRSRAVLSPRRARRESHPPHLFPTATARILVATLTGRCSLGHLDLAPAVRIGTAIAFAFLKRHSTDLLDWVLQLGQFACFDRLDENVPLRRTELDQVAVLADTDLLLIDLDHRAVPTLGTQRNP